jgi:hypothetical protein
MHLHKARVGEVFTVWQGCWCGLSWHKVRCSCMLGVWIWQAIRRTQTPSEPSGNSAKLFLSREKCLRQNHLHTLASDPVSRQLKYADVFHTDGTATVEHQTPLFFSHSTCISITQFLNEINLCVLRTAYCVLRTAYCVLRTAYCVPRTAYCVPRTAYISSITVRRKQHSFH